MTQQFEPEIESTKTVYLDGIAYVQVFFGSSGYFVYTTAENYEKWKEATGNYDKH